MQAWGRIEGSVAEALLVRFTGGCALFWAKVGSVNKPEEEQSHMGTVAAGWSWLILRWKLLGACVDGVSGLGYVDDRFRDGRFTGLITRLSRSSHVALWRSRMMLQAIQQEREDAGYRHL